MAAVSMQFIYLFGCTVFVAASGGYSPAVMHGLLVAVASPVAEHRL